MPTVGIIPVKSFTMGKRRLAGAFQPASRARLGMAVAGHVAATVASAGLVPLIVTADPEVAEWAILAGFPSITDPDEGLDAAAGVGLDWASTTSSRWIVLHADLPLLAKSDITALVEVVSDGHEVIAPSADGGTSAIGGTGPIVFSFGVSSFHRHLASMEDPVVVTRPGLLLDIDSPRDVEAAISTDRGEWLRNILETGH